LFSLFLKTQKLVLHSKSTNIAFTNGLIIKWIHSLASEYTISSIRQGYIESNLLVQTIIRPLVILAGRLT
jgi:hypothetical protein